MKYITMESARHGPALGRRTLILSPLSHGPIPLHIDFHSHFYPRAYLEGLKESKGHVSLESGPGGEVILRYSGDYNVVVGGHVDLDERLKAMRGCGVDMQVVSLTTPGVDMEAPELGAKLAKVTNDAFGDISEKFPDRFVALATLPMRDPMAAADELERAVKDRGLRGAMVFSNAAGSPIDGEEYMHFYEKAVKLDVPLFVHPTSPLNSVGMADYRLVPIMGFGVDTSLAILRLVFSGVLERLPGLKLVATHTGGVFPYLRGRIDAAYRAYPETRARIPKPPSEYFKRIWLDTVCYDADVLASSLAFWGPGKMVMGSDYPHQIGDLENCVRRVKGLELDGADEKLVLGGNAARLLNL
ncbi:MAG: amidohydrolase [Nitrososphaerota archaeon]|jgi:aminocarboxymuconate-semialdehyde decarboxylase|nr:amidohydrolase [Nitrososphaerota archaeon]MDG6947635.1 amidohydrolase [Nitrososphaerota archaeon]